MQAYSQRALALLAGLLVVVLGLHFGLTLVYLLPLNPITLRLAPLVDGYMTPFFAQDWHLFAPEPINETRMLLVACRVRLADGRMVETAWEDISTPLWAMQARERFSPASWLVRLQMHAIQRFFAPGQLLPGLERSHALEDPTVQQLADTLHKLERARQVLPTRVLARLGAAYCDRWYGTGQTVAMRMRLAILRFPRFSQRQMPDSAGEVRSYSFDWMPYESVARLNIPSH